MRVVFRQRRTIERGQRLRQQLLRTGACAFETEQRHVGGLVGRGVLAGGLAQRLGIGDDVEDVVHHLEGQPDGCAVLAQAGQRDTAGSSPAQAAPISTLPCSSAPVLRRCIAQLGFAQAAANAGEVDGLAAGHALAAGRPREQAHQPRLHGRGDVGVVRHQQLEGQRRRPAASASPNFTWTVGLPRRSTSLSMHGRSSCTSE